MGKRIADRSVTLADRLGAAAARRSRRRRRPAARGGSGPPCRLPRAPPGGPRLPRGVPGLRRPRGPRQRGPDPPFERLSGSRIAWAYFSNNWFGGRIHFPAEHVGTISRAGRVPFIRMMARSGYRRGRGPELLDAVDRRRRLGPGARRWCDGARDTGSSAAGRVRHRGQRRLVPVERTLERRRPNDGYGNPHYADGPERFRDAYRRIVDLCRARGRATTSPGSSTSTWAAGHDAVEPDRELLAGGSLRRLDRPERLRAAEAGRAMGELPRPARPGLSAGSQPSAPQPIAVLEYGATEEPAIPGGQGALDSARDPRRRRASLAWHRRALLLERGRGETRTARSPTCGSTPRARVAARLPPRHRAPRLHLAAAVRGLETLDRSPGPAGPRSVLGRIGAPSHRDQRARALAAPRRARPTGCTATACELQREPPVEAQPPSGVITCAIAARRRLGRGGPTASSTQTRPPRSSQTT